MVAKHDNRHTKTMGKDYSEFDHSDNDNEVSDVICIDRMNNSVSDHGSGKQEFTWLKNPAHNTQTTKMKQ